MQKIELGRGFVLCILDTGDGSTWCFIDHKNNKKATEGPHPTSDEYKKAKFIQLSLKGTK